MALALAGDGIIPPFSPGLGLLPCALDELLGFEVVKQRIQRPLAKRQDIAASVFDRLAQFIGLFMVDWRTTSTLPVMDLRVPAGGAEYPP